MQFVPYKFMSRWSKHLLWISNNLKIFLISKINDPQPWFEKKIAIPEDLCLHIMTHLFSASRMLNIFPSIYFHVNILSFIVAQSSGDMIWMKLKVLEKVFFFVFLFPI